jgi:tRNA-modifying protein YgfZ
MHGPWTLVSLESLGALRVRGRDAIAFLQGQLSADVTRLSPGHSELAGYHNPQGRVLALLHLLALSSDEVLAILPRELTAPIAGRLRGFILRSKVTLEDASDGWRFEGLIGPDAHAAPGAAPAFARQLPEAPSAVARIGPTLSLRIGGAPARWLLATPSTAPTGAGAQGLESCERADPQLWRRLAIEAGEPQIRGSTSGEFVAQMLNLDVLGAIAFDKGCYTGQEVIARAHYRGRVKRRLQRFRTTAPVSLQPGEAGELTDGRSFRIVDAVALPDGGSEFLAVAPLAAAAPSDTAAAAGGVVRLSAAQLPLPYALPE